MRRGGRTGSKHSGNRHVRVKKMDSEDSDEDYVAEVDEIYEQSDELDSFVGDNSEDESCFEEEEHEAEDEGEWRTVVKTSAPKRSAKCRKNGIKRPKKRRKVSRDDDEDSDDDDEEFTPDEVESSEEEEEFPLLKTKTKKRGRTTSKRKSPAKRQIRKRSTKATRKPLKKRSKKTTILRKKAKSGDDEDFVERGLTLRGRSEKKPSRRKKRVISGSDSDFCSDSSDYEFTISEEELEQIKEADKICRNLTTNLRSSKRIQEDETFCERRKPLVRKGKEKAVETKNDVGKPVCGICLTEEGKNTIRGTLNCCSHYFCFACIMEWSKVETRCPLCKQRFVTITKPSRCDKGFDLRNVVMQVPERDQVYQPSEEELRDFLNPYENVICTECHHGGDDALMLLCDLCDSPAHTYCVGLGREVPEGNWYCDGCRPVAPGSSHTQTQDLTSDQRTNTGASNEPSTYENMAEIDLNVTIPETPVSQGNGFFSSPRFSGGSFQSPSLVSGMGVSTVSGRRRIHLQIRHLLSNRLSQMPPGSDITSLGALIGREINSPFEQTRTIDLRMPHNARHIDRYQENPSHNVRNGDFCSIDQASTSADGSGYGVQWGGLDSVNLGPSQTHISSNEHLRPCTSRFGPDDSASPSVNRDRDHTIIVKQQVYSIVKHQLTSMSREMDLGHNTCAEISRRATDTIMAAYGLEPRWHDIHEVRPAFCLHVERLPNVGMSPMNGCCLTCFENFVKDVVKRIMVIILGRHWLGFRH